MNPVITQPIPGRQGRPSLLLSDVTSFLEILWQPGDVREIRIPQHNQWRHTASGYFDGPDKLAEAVSAWDGKSNLYVTLNPVDPALLSRAANRIAPRATNTTSDADVVVRRFLFLDIDSIRPAGISATDEELEGARELLVNLTSGLALQGWPEPVTCLSGNGYYALYRIDLPNTPDVLQLLERVLGALATTYNTQTTKIDTAVANAGRILGLVGTLKVKGDASADRPHRRSLLLSVPSAMATVPRALLEEVAATLSPRGAARNQLGAGQARPLPEVLDEAGIDYREQPPDTARIIWYHVRSCPFHGEDHPYECGVGQGRDGHYAGKCFHDPSKRWREWKRALGLGKGSTPSRVGDGGSQEAVPGPRLYPRTDAGNAELFADLHGDGVRYDHRRDKWLVWASHHWEHDADGRVARLAIETARTRYREAEHVPDLAERQAEAKFAVQSENRQRLEAMLASARSLHPITVTGEDWDKEPLLFGAANGVVDLRTGRLRAGRPDDLLTLSSPVFFEAEAACPRWERFLLEVFQQDTDLVTFAQLAVGYALTGLTSEQCLFLLYGQGANGKSVFLNILGRLLGSYAYNAPFSTFELRGRTDISNDIAAFAGRRLVTASETNEGTRLNEARFKALTGGDPITARFLYGEHFTFRPQAKIFLAVNHLPVVEDLSFGFWRRVRLLPFTRTFVNDADPTLEEKLRAELPGILAWAVAGALAWQRTGLSSPASVLAATSSYREASDPLADFVGECLAVEPPRSVGSAEAYARYQTWARNQGIPDKEMLTHKCFGLRMGDRFPAKKTKTGKRFLGVGIAGDPVQEVMT
jgi:putative DNA primase/helicase